MSDPDDDDIEPARAPPSLRSTHAPRAQQVPPRTSFATSPSGDATVDDRTKAPYLLRALRFAVQLSASDLHFHCGLPLIARVAGRPAPFQGHEPLSRPAAEKDIAQILH